MRIELCLNKIQNYICADSITEAESIAWSRSYLHKPSEVNINILSPEEGGEVALNQLVNIRVDAGDILCKVKAEFSNGDKDINLYDEEDNGVYENTWIPQNKGDCKITVTASNCANIGSVDVKVREVVSDTTPLASITNLLSTAGQTWISWTWTDPMDIDFSKVLVYLDGSFRANVSKRIQYYNATNLEPDTMHTISTRTVDTSENLNQTWVNNSVITAPIITPNQSPIANFTYSPESPVVNQTITFDASSSKDSDGTIVSYEWNFGDGTTIDGVIVTHSYLKAGNYTVTLTVTDDKGATNSITDLLNIKTIKGDFNGNGVVDLGDATYVAYMVVGKVPVNMEADFNGNGRVDIGDAAKIAYYLVGKISEL